MEFLLPRTDKGWAGARRRRRSRERQQHLQPGAKVAAINGNLPFDSMLADGATTTPPMSQNSDVIVFETTSEAKISTNGFSAEYGQGGIIFNQIPKGGTNQFHGAGYEYHHKRCDAHARSQQTESDHVNDSTEHERKRREIGPVRKE